MSIHWTTITDSISGNKKAVDVKFAQVLMYCNELGLIGGENFAVDGNLYGKKQKVYDQTYGERCKTFFY